MVVWCGVARLSLQATAMHHLLKTTGPYVSANGYDPLLRAAGGEKAEGSFKVRMGGGLFVPYRITWKDKGYMGDMHACFLYFLAVTPHPHPVPPMRTHAPHLPPAPPSLLYWSGP